MKRRRNIPDLRHDWRDPDMPVMRCYTFANGSIIDSLVDPDYERRFREMVMNNCHNDSPNWRSDPTYNLRRKKR